MLKPVEDLDTWIVKYDLKPIERNCRCCGKSLKTVIPVATRKFRGLVSEPHECGSDFDIMTLKPIDREMINLMSSFSF